MIPSKRFSTPACCVILLLSVRATGQQNPNVVPPPPEVQRLQLTRPFTLVYRGEMSVTRGTGTTSHRLLRLVLSYDGKNLLFQSTDLATKVTRTILFDGRDTYTADSNSSIASIDPGFWYMYLLECPLPGVGIPYEPLATYGIATRFVSYMTRYLAPQLAMEKALVAPALYTTPGQVRHIGMWTHPGVPGRVQPMSFPVSIVTVSSAGAPKALWYAAFGNPSAYPSQLWEFFDHKRFEGLWIAARVKVRRYHVTKSNKQSTLWLEATYSLERSTPGPLDAAAYDPATYLSLHANVTDFTGTAPRAFVYEPGHGTLQEARRRAGVPGAMGEGARSPINTGLSGLVALAAALVAWFGWRKAVPQAAQPSGTSEAYPHGTLPPLRGGARSAPWRRTPSAPLGSTGAVLTAVAALVIFSAYLAPNVVLAWLDRWGNLIFWSSRGGGAVAVALATLSLGSYLPAVFRREDAFGLWLITAVWLGLSAAVILHPLSQADVVGDESILLLAYGVGLAGARVLPRLDSVIAILVACGALRCVLAIALAVAPAEVVPPGDVRLQWLFQSPKDLLPFPVLILPFAVHGVLEASRPRARAFYLFSTAMMVAGLLILHQWTAAIAALIGVLWLVRNRAEVRRRVLLLALALAVVLGVIFLRIGRPLTAPEIARSFERRMELVRSAAARFGHHWLEGAGAGVVRTSMVAAPSGGREGAALLMEAGRIYDPQSQFLLWLDQMGIAGGLLLLGFGWFAWRIVRGAQAAWADAAAASWLSLALAGVFNTLFGISDLLSSGSILFASLVGITMRLQGSPAARAPQGSPPPNAER
ncbi:MAG: hypothetical protein ACP5VE_11885 [Chthonomonadales bacterium]